MMFSRHQRSPWCRKTLWSTKKTCGGWATGMPKLEPGQKVRILNPKEIFEKEGADGVEKCTRWKNSTSTATWWRD